MNATKVVLRKKGVNIFLKMVNDVICLPYQVVSIVVIMIRLSLSASTFMKMATDAFIFLHQVVNIVVIMIRLSLNVNIFLKMVNDVICLLYQAVGIAVITRGYKLYGIGKHEINHSRW